MKKEVETEILTDLRTEKEELEGIESEIFRLRERLLDRVPEHFSTRDIINAFFGSLIIGLTFILKGATVRIAVGLDLTRVLLLIALTLFILMTEIYFIGYSRVKDKSHRKMGQFMTKRLVALYFITVITSFLLVYLLNLNNSPDLHDFNDVMKLVAVVAFPCAVGAAVPNLLQKY